MSGKKKPSIAGRLWKSKKPSIAGRLREIVLRLRLPAARRLRAS
jgi:hypothetical protein